jgi:hypothetical protein
MNTHPMTKFNVATLTQMGFEGHKHDLSHMAKEGLIRRVGRGWYQAKEKK